MDAPDNENSFLRFHFAGYFGYELPVARINFARLQCSPKVPTIQPAVAAIT